MTYRKDGDSTDIEAAATKLRSFTTDDQSRAAQKIAARLFPDEVRKPGDPREEVNAWIDRFSLVCELIKTEWPL